MEWKELKKDNLPPDIFIGDYEFNYGDQYSGEGGNFENDITASVERRYHILRSYLFSPNKSSYVYYRKPEPKQPTHEEIMTKWWLCDNDWQKVTGYHTTNKEYFKGEDWNDKLWFINKESADIPPEVS